MAKLLYFIQLRGGKPDLNLSKSKKTGYNCFKFKNV